MLDLRRVALPRTRGLGRRHEHPGGVHGLSPAGGRARRCARAVVILSGLAFGGCLFGPLEPPSEPPELIGLITSIDTTTLGHTRILVEEDPEVFDTRTSRKGYFTIKSTTILVRRTNGSWRKGGVEDLQMGALVSAWYDTGLILDSYPRQGRAEHIAVLVPPSN